MLAAPASAYRGEQLHELTLKRVLQRLAPGIHFDLGANLNLWHPKINRWQGVYHQGRHIAAMGRGLLPEFNLYREEPLDDGAGYGRGELLELGWRSTLESVVRAKVPGITWFGLCLELGVEYKKFTGNPNELHVREQGMDPILNTLG